MVKVKLSTFSAAAGQYRGCGAKMQVLTASPIFGAFPKNSCRGECDIRGITRLTLA
jgi:hypothetical protein